MTSFMGPMAPPPAAPPQPQALDIRTDPNQRQQFKQFMRQRTATMPMQQQPPMQPLMMQPPMPMMPPSMPMGQDIDIFNPVNLHEGGIVPSLNSLQQQAAQFSQQLQSTVMGGGQVGGMGAGMGGGGFGGSFNSGGGMGGGGFSSPGFTTNTTSGGLVPGGLKSVSPPPDANVSDFFQNFNNTNSGLTPSTSLGSPSENSYLNFNPNQTPNDPNRYKNPTIDQGFYESDLFKNLDMSGPRTADMQPASEATGGFSGSSTDIGRLKNAYQQYLQGGQQGGMQQAVVNPQVDPNPFFGGSSPQRSVQTRPTRPELPFQAYTGGSSTFDESAPYNSIGSLGQNMFGFEDGGAVPPRNTDIRGQDHMLSYITPDEADILMALGGSGEAGPMGIPSFPEPGMGGDQDSRGGSGNEGGGSSGGGGGGGGFSDFGGGMNEGQDNTGIADAAGYGPGSSDTSNSDADEISDAIEDIAAAEKAGQEADDRAAARDRAIRDAFVTTASGKPIGTPGSPSGKFGGNLGKESASKADVGKALAALAGIPGTKENEAATAAAANAAVFGVPTDPLSSSNKGLLLGLDPQDLLAIENFSYAPPAQTNVSLSRNPSSLTGRVSALGMSPVESMARFGNPNMAGMTQSQIDNFTEQGLVTDVAPVASAPSSNVVAASVDPLTQDPMTVARAMQGIQAPGLMDLGIISNLGKGLQSLVGSLTGAPTQEEINAAYANRSPDLVGISPGLAIAALGVDKGIPAAGMIGMTPDGKPAAITGDMLADINTRSQDDPLGLNVLSGFFNDMTLSDASASKVAVVDPETNTVNDTQGRIVGAIDGYGRYTGNPDFNPYAGPQGQGDGGPDQPVKAPTDPCPDGFVMKNGACTPIETDTGSDFPNQIGGMTPGYNAPPVIVPSSRFPGYSLQGPVGYGSPIAGQAAPSVATNAAMYQQMMLQGMRPPLRLEDGGAVPPRNVEISGQDHMLSYITPDEADILKALGGSGEPGPMGIPSFENGNGGDATPYQQGRSFYLVPAGGSGKDQEYKRVFFGTDQDTMENRISGSSSLASVTQDMVGGPPQAVNRDEYLREYERRLAALQGRPDPYPDPVPVVQDLPGPVVDPAPTDPNAYNPIMDVVVPSTRLQDFPASAPPASTQPMPFQGSVGYGSPIAGQGPSNINPLLSGAVNPLYSNALNFQNMLNQPFPLNFQQGGVVSSNLDMAADNFLKALMPAA
jgi:hypothetical protein